MSSTRLSAVSLASLIILAAIAVSSPVSAQSQQEMNAQAGAELESADAKLNQVYQNVLKQNADNALFCANLKEAQRTWLKFVDLHLKTLFPLKDGEDPRVVYGSIYPMEYAAAKTAVIEQRIAQLQEMLNTP